MSEELQNIRHAPPGMMELQDRAVLGRLNTVQNTMVNSAPRFPLPAVAANMLPEQVKFVDTDANLSKKQKRSRSVRVPRLVSRNKRGGRYVRPRHVKEELRSIRLLDPSEWPGRARHLQNETLICLIRLMQDANPDVAAALDEVLSKRVNSRARKRCYWLRKFDKEQFASDVEMRVRELVFNKDPFRKRDYLELRFGKELKNLIDDQWSKFKDSAGDFVEIRRWSPKRHDDDDGEISRKAMERLVDPAVGPEDGLLNLDVNNRRHQILRAALNAITDPNGRLLVILHHVSGIPITSSKRGKDSLQRHFRKDPGRIKRMIDTGIAQMRAAMAAMGIHSLDCI